MGRRSVFSCLGAAGLAGKEITRVAEIVLGQCCSCPAVIKAQFCYSALAMHAGRYGKGLCGSVFEKWQLYCQEGRVYSSYRESCNSECKGGFWVRGVGVLRCGASRIGAVAADGIPALARASSTAAATVSRPSVTWGVIQSTDERLRTREKVFELLRDEGINTSELLEIELPSTVEVVKERLNFLRKLGLDNKDINNYPLMIGCSVRKNMIPVLDYLEKLGIERRFFPQFVKRYPMVLHSSVVIDLKPAIDYIKGLDIEKKDIPRVLLRFPDVLGFKLEGTISTSVAYLVSIGINMKEIGCMLTDFPEILGMRVASVIKPKVDYLISLGLPKTIVARILERRPQLLGYDLNEAMRPAIDELLKAGVQKESIAGVVAQYPEILQLPVKRSLDAKISWLTKRFKVSPDDVPRIIEKLPQVLSIKESSAMNRISFLKNAGFSTKNVASMVVYCPQILVLSIDQSLKPNLKFLVDDMKRDLKEVVDFPAFFTYNLERRIRPRYRMVARKGLKCSLAWLLNCSDQKFVERLDSEIVGEHELIPVFTMGGLLPQCADKDGHSHDAQPKTLQVGTTGIAVSQSSGLGNAQFQTEIPGDTEDSEDTEFSEVSDREEIDASNDRDITEGEKSENESDSWESEDSELSEESDEEEFEPDSQGHSHQWGQASEDELETELESSDSLSSDFWEDEDENNSEEGVAAEFSKESNSDVSSDEDVIGD
eukprot:c28065_g1_i2 orf=103-2241(-)